MLRRFIPSSFSNPAAIQQVRAVVSDLAAWTVPCEAPAQALLRSSPVRNFSGSSVRRASAAAAVAKKPTTSSASANSSKQRSSSVRSSTRSAAAVPASFSKFSKTNLTTSSAEAGVPRFTKTLGKSSEKKNSSSSANTSASRALFSSSSSSSSSSNTTSSTAKKPKSLKAPVVAVEKDPKLNPEQQRVLEFVKKNPKRSVFITGGAGTGKSVLLRAIAKALPSDVTYITAPTGVAALNVGGITLHSFLRFTPDTQFDLRGFMTSKVFADVQRRFWTCETIVIDEISMVDPSVFQAADRIAQLTRGSHLPFGGMRLVICGDFMQLPPVSTSGDGARQRMLDDAEDDDDGEGESSSSSSNNKKLSPSFTWRRGQKTASTPANRCAADTDSKYCFQTAEWQNLNPKYFTLKQVMRQRQPELIDLLNAVRFGRQTDAMMKKLLLPPEESSVEADVLDAAAPVRIFCRNKEVNDRNRMCFNTVKGKVPLLERHYDAEAATPEIPLRREMIYQCAMQGDARIFGKIIPKTLRLCVGARVMLLRNLDVGGGLVNGSTGVVVGFRDQSADVETETLSEQVQFKLAGKVDGIASSSTSNSNSNSGVTDEQVNDSFEMKFRDKPSDPLQVASDIYPVVKFNGVKDPIVVRPVVWTQKSGSSVASKLMQVPLRHAWAATAHKVQGCSFEKVHVDISSAFEYGQAYVALSRARSIEHLRVIGYDAKKVQACPIASDFHLNTATKK